MAPARCRLAHQVSSAARLSPDERIAEFLALEPERRALTRLIHQFVHSHCVEESAVDHDVPDVVRRAQVLEWILVEDDEVGQLAAFERYDVAIQPEVLGSVKR